MNTSQLSHTIESTQVLSNLCLHNEAIRVLNASIEHAPNLAQFKAVRQDLLNVEKAAQEFHLNETEEAMSTLAKVSAQNRDANPSLEARVQSVYGLISRRHAYIEWKSGNVDLGLAHCEEANKRFLDSGDIAIYGQANLQAENSKLNVLYTQGLAAAIQNTSISFNPDLMEKMLSCINTLDAHSPQTTRDRLTGYIMLADLGRGCNQTLHDFNRVVLRSEPWLAQPGSWAEMLLTAERHSSGLAQRFKALNLAAAFLLNDSPHAVNRSTVLGVMYRLENAKLDCQRNSGLHNLTMPENLFLMYQKLGTSIAALIRKFNLPFSRLTFK